MRPDPIQRALLGFSVTISPMKILSAAEMQTCDRVTTERFGVPSTTLMRAAAEAVARFVPLHFPNAKRVTVICGRGNNGGDGLMAARLLVESGFLVKVLMIGDPDELHGDAEIAWDEMMGCQPSAGCSVRIILSADDLADLSEALEADLVIDAVVGTGFHPPLRGLPMEVLGWLRNQENLPPVLAVDLPSGWDADSTEATAAGPVYPADTVVTFTAPKPAHVFGQLTSTITQPVVVAQIGSPEEAIESELDLYWAGTSKTISDPDRSADSNKGMYGHVLVVGGSGGKSGAPAMTSLAALRTGAGLVTAAVAPSVQPLVAGVAPELMTEALAVGAGGAISTRNLATERMQTLLHRKTVLAVGPGLGTAEETVEFVIGLLTQSRLPAVVDADALNAISQQIEILPDLAHGRLLVLTPHPGEMSRLTGLSIEEIQSNRIDVAQSFAEKYGVTLVLKGWRTLIAHADGRVAVNTSGNPAMAKGGSGDLLTGMIAAFLAQYADDPHRAVEAAVYLHGLAADIAVRDAGGDQHTLLATDSLTVLHRAFRFHSLTDSGYGWLQGMPADV